MLVYEVRELSDPRNMPSEHLVLVVGGGPVGLAAGCLLTVHGIRVLLVERNPTTSDAPKAISIDDESLRMLKLAGLGQELDRIILPGTGTQYFGCDGRPLFRAGTPEPFRFGHPFKNPFAQPELEGVLCSTLRGRSGAQVRFGCELTDLNQRPDHVEAEVRDVNTGTTETVHADYVVACDGGRSIVRELLHVGMTGRSYDDPWLVADVLGDPHRERYGLHYGDPERPCVIIPGVRGRCRYEFLLSRGEGEPAQPPAFELTQRLLAPYRSIRADQIERAVVYTFNAVVADRWQVERVFLAGDAAHMMPPFAGQGLNSGLRDVGNLAWKLADVLHGRLAASVLSSYETERRSHAEATVGLSERLGRIVFTTSRSRARLRDIAIRMALRSQRGRRYFEQMRYRRPPRLDDGLIVRSGTDDPVGTALRQPRVFDVSAHRARLLDDVTGNGWSLIGVEIAEDWWQRVHELTRLAGTEIDIGLDISPVPAHGRYALTDLDGGAIKAFEGLRGRFVLVRPDRVVAAVFAPDNADPVIASVRQWLAGSPITDPAAAEPAPPQMEVR
jgi:3-(3-hydroxy-phenyl)propionate hydroxylase